MILFVYALRKNGQRLPTASILHAPPVRGRLVFREVDGLATANLYDEAAGDLIEPLLRAQVKRINMGMHLVGLEQHSRGAAKSKVHRLPQAWLCAAEASILAPLVRLIPQPPPSTGFDPADDDRDD